VFADPERRQEAVLLAREFLVLALALEQPVQFHTFAPEEVVLLDEGLDDAHQFARLRLIRGAIVAVASGTATSTAVRGRIPGRSSLLRLEERERIRAPLGTEDLVLPHLFQVGARLAQPLVEFLGPVRRLARARLGEVGASPFGGEVLEDVGVRDLELFQGGRGGDEFARVVREAGDGLAVLFERDEQGAV
jgi:hypothetical protein